MQGVKTREECEALCESTPECNAVVYNRGLKDIRGRPMCYPKTISDSTPILPSTNESADYLNLCPRPPPPPSPPSHPPPAPPPPKASGATCECPGTVCAGTQVCTRRKISSTNAHKWAQVPTSGPTFALDSCSFVK